jgi:hypothetical protein
VPPPPPPLSDSDGPLTFDDEDRDLRGGVPPPPTFHSPLTPPELGEKAMVSINRRPRRLAAPAMAVAAVLVLVVVLLLTGSHPAARPHHPAAASNGGNGPPASQSHKKTQQSHKKKTPTTTTTATPTTAAPAVSAPASSTASTATYRVSEASFTMTLAATSGACWVDATDSTTGATLYTGTLGAGQRQSFNATSPVTVVVGAPSVFVASVDGVAAVLPTGSSTPFTMNFVTPAPST